MATTDLRRDALLPGALAGLIGGLVFGAALNERGMLPEVAALVHANGAGVGFVVHLVIAAVVGAGFGALIVRQRVTAGETLFWGLAYGAFWWFLGPLTLMPLLMGDSLTWDVHSAQEAFPSLLGHLLYGGVTALALVMVRRTPAPQSWGETERSKAPALTATSDVPAVGGREPQDRTSPSEGRPFPGPGDRHDQAVRQMSSPQHWGAEGGRPGGGAVRGAVAGLLAAWLVGTLLVAQGRLHEFTAMDAGAARFAQWAAVLLVGALAGAGFGLLYPRSVGSAGAALVRGMVYGFLWWVAAAMTVLPLLGGNGLTWSLADARAGFAALIAYLLFGAAMGLVHGWLGTVGRVLFSDQVRGRDAEGAGTAGLRAVGRGVIAGLIGGLLFTVVMVQVGFLPTVASLIGSDSEVTGLIVHLLISFAIGMAYGLLFRGQSFDLGSALGWGVSYGFFWWVLGPLTLLPLLLGHAPDWSIETAAGLTASLVGHIAYGAGLGITFHRLEARYNPWWIPVREMELARAEARRQQLLSSAPALWALVVVIALTLPVVVGM